MEEECQKLWLGDRLPTIYDASLHIYYLAPRPQSDRRKKVINQYAASLHALWVQSFGTDHVKSRLQKILSRIMSEYDKYKVKHVYGNAKRGIPGKPIRIVNRDWLKHCIEHHAELTHIQEKQGRPSKTKSTPVDQSREVKNECGLLDIGLNTVNLTGAEKVFFEDQNGLRRFRVSTEIDEEYVKEKEKEYELQMKHTEEDIANESFSNPVDCTDELPSSSTTPNRTERYIKRSVQLAFTLHDQEEQVDTRRELRDTRNFLYAAKDAIATISYRCAISIEKARIAFIVVCLIWYGDRYYLTPEEQETSEPSTESNTDYPKTKKPRTADDYARYKYVVPSAKVANEHKHNKALHQEIKAANALGNRDDETKVTLHYDTTTRSQIDGEWPSLILNFLNDDPTKCDMIPLRALFFAFENREQIIKLIVETLKRLSVASGEKFSAKDLWENITCIMTDAVTKNLKIEHGVAKSLGSNHIPYHILCKSHTCEKLDEACLKALISVETEVNYAQLIIKKQPQLKSFIRQTNCISFAAIKAMLKLVAHQESGKPTSLAKEFDLQLEKDGVYKSMCLYKERRFTKLGYSAAAILDCMTQYETILESTTHNNLLVQACRLYSQSEYVRAALKALGYFTFKVTMPFLNCVERCDQNSLLPLLKQIHEELKEGKMDTLEEYKVPWTHIKTEILQPDTALDRLLLQRMCLEAAKGIHMQCAGEYWEDSENPRATQLHKLSFEERKNLPTENLLCERYLSRFGSLAEVSAAKRNKFFKAKRIRDDLMFDNKKMTEDEVEKTTRNVLNKLKSMEVSWTTIQKQAWKEKIEEAIKKNSRKDNYKDLLLIKCKENGGPTSSTSDVNDMVARITDQKKLKACLRTEVGFQKALHPFDSKERSHLYKMNQLSVEEMIENLLILFDTSTNHEVGEDIEFPTEDEIYELLNNTDIEVSSTEVTEQEDSVRKFVSEEPVAVIWDSEDDRYWCIGFFIQNLSDDEIQVDHLKCKRKGEYGEWVRPERDDVQPVHHVQVLPVNVLGEWDFSKRLSVYRILNLEDIQNVFNDF